MWSGVPLDMSEPDERRIKRNTEIAREISK
jgi:hypothetical protein